jgi:acyl transferase domain-containing protein/acyl carrier protein
MNNQNETTGFEVAVIGMSCIFPGANNIQQFWENLKEGVSSIRHFNDDELRSLGVQEELINSPNFVKSYGYINESNCFDYRFFGYSPNEAGLMNPQTRIFHECCWGALEDAGYIPDKYNGLIGLFCGAGTSSVWETCVNLEYLGSPKYDFLTKMMADKDSMSTIVSYALGLNGPSLQVKTACSTSLVSVNQACQSLNIGECDMALAGGVTLSFPRNYGYRYENNMVMSQDGYCRPFDQNSDGFVGGEGVGVVVLKRLENAIEDKDNIYAIIKGSAINNDGDRKAGYLAPSVEGQAEVIKNSLDMAEISPESLSYIECHGSATRLGDSIEIEALKKVFMSEQEKCIIGSVKANVGHLDSASGIAGFIKTVLIVKNREIPPLVNFTVPNPLLDISNSAFHINKIKEVFDKPEKFRAGVSSFGIGGTNAHVILEEYLQNNYQSDETTPCILLFTAKTENSLRQKMARFISYLPEKKLNVCDIEHTLMFCRKHFEWREFVVASKEVDLIDKLNRKVSKSVVGKAKERKKVIFLFSGLGSQYTAMARGLYNTYPIFKEEIDTCLQILEGSGYEYFIRDYLLSNEKAGSNQLYDKDGQQFTVSQLMLFVFEYSLARFLIAINIVPDNMIGYSLGEYVAACISGVLSLAGTLNLLIERGKLIEKTPVGKMASIPLRFKELKNYLPQHVSIAIDNGDSCIVSGKKEHVDTMIDDFVRRKVICMPLTGNKAIHSIHMEPVADEFKQILDPVKFNTPKVPFVSNVTGLPVSENEVVSSEYWVKHLVKTVEFDKGINTILTEPGLILIEIGPGKDLCSLISAKIDQSKKQTATNLIRPEMLHVSDVDYFLNRLGALWTEGININWDKVSENKYARKISLPTYAFDKSYFDDQGLYGSLLRFAGLLNTSLINKKARTNGDNSVNKVLSPAFSGKKETKFELERPDQLNDYVAPANKTEEVLEAFWKEIFGYSKIGALDNFFELGGNSMKAITSISMIAKRFSLQIPITIFYKIPTIKEIAGYITDAGIRNKYAGAESFFVQYNKTSKDYVFCFPPFIPYGSVYNNLANNIKDFSIIAFDFQKDKQDLESYINVITSYSKENIILFGYSAGGVMAFEIAKLLEQRNIKVSKLILLDIASNWNVNKELLTQGIEEFRNKMETQGIKADGDQIIEDIRIYNFFVHNLTLSGTVNTDIHLITSPTSRSNKAIDFYRWETVTNGSFRQYEGYGNHHDMIDTEAARNSAVISKILKI